jgi:F-type H+-transporting ATPase subunit gamma
VPFLEVFQNAKPEEAPKRKLFVVISSDKGLCGGIHSSVSKATRRSITAGENGGSTDSPVVVIGDKSKAQLSRAISSNLAITFNQIGRDIPTFADAAGVADLIVKAGIKYDAIAIVHNKFISALSYEHTVVEVLNDEVLKEAGGLKQSLRVDRPV